MGFRILFLASEATPLAKTGGLADVAGALCKTLYRKGHDVRLILPLYRQIDRSVHTLTPVESLQGLALDLPGRRIRFSVMHTKLPGSEAPVYLIDAPEFFHRDSLYGVAPDEGLRFLIFCHAALITAQHLKFAPDILHCNDWHTGLAPLLMRTQYAWDQLFQKTRALFSIHNLAYQGSFSTDNLLPWGLASSVAELDPIEFAAQRVNPLREGIRHADYISTVSPTYAREIQSPAQGCGLDTELSQRRARLHGILNGVDYTEWDPRYDPYLPLSYDANHVSVKAQLKDQLLQRLSLTPIAGERVPLVGMVTRLVTQKGIDLVMQVLPGLLQSRDMRVAILGSGDAQFEQFFTELAATHPTRVSFRRGYDEAHAHWIEAASDIFLMPSRYEPCGLNQMYSLRYGTIPVVRRTGGLADSVKHYDPNTRLGTGIIFNDADAGGLLWGLSTALDWYSNARLWQPLVRNAMAQDFSWDRQVRGYEHLYAKMLATN